MSLENVLYILLAVLIGGTLFSWYEFSKVVLNKCDTCSVGLHKSPFRSKCFVGAVFFTLALALAIYAVTLV